MKVLKLELKLQVGMYVEIYLSFALKCKKKLIMMTSLGHQGRQSNNYWLPSGNAKLLPFL